ncbi:MAG TPA: sigma 54-interacting transcriptional regulator [Polyangiaceae bacterium]
MSAPEDADELSTILNQRFDPTPPSDAAFVLRVVEGPDAGKSFVLHGAEPRALVGQSPSCTIRLTDRAVSRRHVALEVKGDALRLTDLGSTNGTMVDRVSIDGAHLRGGETVRLGSTVLQVERAPRGTSVPAVPLDVSFGRVFGASREMRRLYPLCQRLAAADVPVIIEGETGTGKEVLAESIHESGPRAAGPFVVFDCTAVLPSLMESELFGHERGAFTGAVGQRKGLFEQASGGTLLIDEIGDLDATLQPKLLRAVERGEIRRVGGDRWIKVDARILAATRRDLDEEVQQGRFRDDLFHRLAVGRVELPPLRERKGDVALLAAHFWKALGGDPRGPDASLLARWDKQPWPGNVRELRNAVARQIAIGDLQATTEVEAVPVAVEGEDFIDGVVASKVPLIRGREVVVEEYERRYIERVLSDHGGNVVHAAKASGIARRYFQRLRARRSKT